jgi:DNA-binding transcriptional MerR regulator
VAEPSARSRALAGVTVRTLHHYDRIALLSPSGRSPSGYRQYAPSDLGRLQQRATGLARYVSAL